MKLLVTGGAGFIGSNFVRHMLSKHSDVEIVNLDALTYAGNLENLAGLESDRRHVFVKADISDAPGIEALSRATSSRRSSTLRPRATWIAAFTLARTLS